MDHRLRDGIAQPKSVLLSCLFYCNTDLSPQPVEGRRSNIRCLQSPNHIPNVLLEHLTLPFIPNVLLEHLTLPFILSSYYVQHSTLQTRGNLWNYMTKTL